MIRLPPFRLNHYLPSSKARFCFRRIDGTVGAHPGLYAFAPGCQQVIASRLPQEQCSMRARSVFPHGVVVSVLVVSGTYLGACQSTEPRTDAERLVRGREIIQRMSDKLGSTPAFTVTAGALANPSSGRDAALAISYAGFEPHFTRLEIHVAPLQWKHFARNPPAGDIRERHHWAQLRGEMLAQHWRTGLVRKTLFARCPRVASGCAADAAVFRLHREREHPLQGVRAPMGSATGKRRRPRPRCRGRHA